MTTQERRLVQSEIGALKKMLARLPESSVIDRMSLEARKKSLEEELASQRQAGAEEVPPGYKRTEVGVIPEEWEVVTLGKVCTLYNGRAYALSEWEDIGVPVIRLQNLTGSNDYYYSRLNLPEQKYCKRGDLLYMWSATFGPQIWNGEWAIYHYHIWKVVPHNDITSQQYLFYKLEEITEEKKTRASNGGTMLHVTKASMESTPISLPPLPEQRAIAAALSDADGLIGALDTLIEKKRAIKQAAMQQLLTGKKRLPGFEGKWETKRLGEVASIRNQKVLPSNVDPDTLCVELEHIGQGDGRLLEVSIAQNSTSSKYRFFTGDVLFGRLRSYLRKFWHADRDGICTTEIWPLMADASLIDSRFLYSIVQSDRFIEAASISYGTHMPRADWNVMKNFEIHLPPLPEQTAIAAVLSDMDAEIAALERRREKAEQIKQGMMQQLLTGRIRLVEPPEAAA